MKTYMYPTGRSCQILYVRIILVLLIVSLLISTNAVSQEITSLTIGDITAEDGKKVTGKLSVNKGIDKETFIPITILKGTQPGPVLTLCAGVHATEYVPVMVLQEMVKKVDLKELKGTLVLIHIANIPAYLARIPYSNPVDLKNLNRTFPGNKDGTISERIAHTITQEILSKTDYYIDLHGGEFNEQVIDYLYFYYNCPDSIVSRKSRQMAHATGNKYLVPYDYRWVPDNAPSEYSDFEALRQGAAAITLEWGDQGMFPQEEIDFALKGLFNVMRLLEMLPGKAYMNEYPVYLMNEKSINSNYNGILYALVDKAQYVTKGAKLAYTTDYWGNILEEYYTPISGIIVGIKVAPTINKGEMVCKVAEVVDEFNP